MNKALGKHAKELAEAGQSRLDELAEFYRHCAVEDLDAAEKAVFSLQDERDIAHIRHAIWSARVLFAQLGTENSDKFFPVVMYGLKAAACNIAAAIKLSAAGGDCFEMLWEAAEFLACSHTRAGMTLSRRLSASPTLAASPMLRDLAEKNPELSAAALRRMLERATGGRMDESAARTVVRKVRAEQAQRRLSGEALEQLIRDRVK